jgi:hypothetical protein
VAPHRHPRREAGRPRRGDADHRRNPALAVSLQIDPSE